MLLLCGICVVLGLIKGRFVGCAKRPVERGAPALGIVVAHVVVISRPEGLAGGAAGDGRLLGCGVVV